MDDKTPDPSAAGTPPASPDRRTDKNSTVPAAPEGGDTLSAPHAAAPAPRDELMDEDADAPVLLIHKPEPRRKAKAAKPDNADGGDDRRGRGMRGGVDWRAWASAILLILSLCYVVAEIEFNMSLLDVAGSVRSDPAKMEDLQVFGRSVSACGCFLLVLGFFSPSGFRVTAGKMRRIYYGIALVSLLPMLLIMWSALSLPDTLPIDPSMSDVVLALLPMLGVAYGSSIGRGRNVFVNVISLLLIVWPTVFLGQKLLIEQALIEHTTWEQRVNARYVLMLRSILEDCTINLDDLALCDAENEQDSVKSARIILGSMWMLSPERIRKDMEENKDKMVQSVAARGMWFSPRVNYDAYVKQVEVEREKIQKQMSRTYYAPYKEASDKYFDAIKQEVLQRQSAKASAEIEREIERGWAQYNRGVREYKQQLSASGYDMLQRLAPHKERLRQFCATRNCPPLLTGKERGLVAEAASDAERQFIQRSGGYTPDIETRAEFMAAYPTQVRLRERVQNYLNQHLPYSGLVLPINWRYEKEAFEKTVETLVKQEVDRQWTLKAPKGMPPGLSESEFFEATGMPPLPTLEKLVMTPDVFFKKAILPKYREILDRMLGTIENEKELYANGQSLSEKGKDYARAVFIPAIALIISLCVVILTMFRWWNIMARSLIAYLMRHHKLSAKLRMPVQVAMALAFVAAIVIVPRFMPNPYAGATYERYRDEAVASAPVTAYLLDWAIHTQPAVYRLGMPIRVVLDRIHDKPAVVQKTAAAPVENYLK